MNNKITVKEQLDLTGKNVVITGGAGFLGLHFAEGIAEMGGVPILIDLDYDSVKEAINFLNEKKIKTYGYSLDITSSDQIKEVFQKIIINHQHLDCLVNAAAFAMKNLEKGGKDFFDTYENGYAHGIRFDVGGGFDVMAASIKILSEGDEFWPWPNGTHGPVRVLIFDDILSPRNDKSECKISVRLLKLLS